MERIGGKGSGSIRPEMTIQKALAGGSFPIRGVKNGGSRNLTINFLYIRMSVPSQSVTGGLLQMDDQVNVGFQIFEARKGSFNAEDGCLERRS